MHWVRDAALILALLWLLLVALTTVRAQEPTPTAAPCTGFAVEGGAATVLGNVLVSLPEGQFIRTLAPPGSLELGVSICHVQSGATIVISGEACVEISRGAPDAISDALLDEIIASCQEIPPNEPPPGYEDCPPGGYPTAGGQTITFLSIEVTLPEGDFVLAPYPEDVVQICRVGGSPTLSLSLTDCHRVDIAPPNDPGSEIAQAIAESCTPLNPPRDSTTPLAASLIQPPSTGDAGLTTDN